MKSTREQNDEIGAASHSKLADIKSDGLGRQGEILP